QEAEVGSGGGGDEDLGVDDGRCREVREQRVVDVREVAVERLQVAALDVEVGGPAEHDGTEPVPLWLEQKRAGLGDRLGGLREHRLDPRRDGEGAGALAHAALSAGTSAT